MEAWQNKKHYSKGNNASENPIPRQEISNPSTCEVRRSGQVTTFVVCVVFNLSFQAVVLLTKTAINHRVFFQNFHQKWKNESCGAQFRYFQIK